MRLKDLTEGVEDLEMGEWLDHPARPLQIEKLPSCGQREAWGRKKGQGGCVITGFEDGTKGQGCRQLPEAIKVKPADSPPEPPDGHGPHTQGACDLHNHQVISACCFKPLGVWSSFPAVTGNECASYIGPQVWLELWLLGQAPNSSPRALQGSLGLSKLLAPGPAA